MEEGPRKPARSRSIPFSVIFAAAKVAALKRVVYGQDTNHEDLNRHLETLEDEARFQSCLLQFIPEERTPVVVAECQADPIEEE